MPSSFHGRLACALALALFAAGGAQAKVLAKVDGAEITDRDLKTAEADLGASLPQQLEGQQREAYVLDYLIDLKLVANAAAKEKLGDDAAFAEHMAYLRDKTLMETKLGQVAKTGVTDAQVQKTYDEAAKAQKSEEEFRARHILVPTEDEAKAALKRVKGGEDFTKVATDVSKDPGSKGGELGWFTKDKMVPEFGAAVATLAVNHISEPVKTQFGWHVIQLEEKRQKEFPPLSAVRDQVTRYVAQKAQSDMILKLREAAKIERTAAPAAAPSLK